jgi:tRNA(Ile)-lysidine synthase
MTPFEEVLARRLDPTSRAPLAVALSGGGDSLALLHLTVDWAKARGRPLLALTVDHGLNPMSARWTVEAGEKARALGADWRALTWEVPKPATGLQAKARTARHGLLAQAAREAGANVLLMAHTADDIAEGDLMRRTDTPGLGRLREWGPSPVWPEGRGVFLLRPLLEVSRTELRGYLKARGADWLDDPANENPHFARVRARQSLSNPVYPRGGGDLGFFAGRTEAQTWVPASAGMSGKEGHDPAGSVEFSARGASLPLAGAVKADGLIGKRVLAAALLCVSGGAKPPRGPELERLLAAIHAGGCATLSGCRVAVREDRVEISRAPPRRGQAARPVEPLEWVRNRFRAACGLVPDEASIPPPS